MEFSTDIYHNLQSNGPRARLRSFLYRTDHSNFGELGRESGCWGPKGRHTSYTRNKARNTVVIVTLGLTKGQCTKISYKYSNKHAINRLGGDQLNNRWAVSALRQRKKSIKWHSGYRLYMQIAESTHRSSWKRWNLSHDFSGSDERSKSFLMGKGVTGT
jgi:hypothetical protein